MLRRCLVAFALCGAMVPVQLAAAAGSFRTGSYRSAPAAVARVNFVAGKHRLTKLNVAAALAVCTGPQAATLAGHEIAFAYNLKGKIRRDGSFKVGISVPAAVVSGSLEGRIRGRSASGTLVLARMFGPSPAQPELLVASPLGPDRCVSGTLKWSAKRL